jgi:hypothetical protein
MISRFYGFWFFLILLITLKADLCSQPLEATYYRQQGNPVVYNQPILGCNLSPHGFDPNDLGLLSLVNYLGPPSLRYPGGFEANYFDYETGFFLPKRKFVNDPVYCPDGNGFVGNDNSWLCNNSGLGIPLTLNSFYGLCSAANLHSNFSNYKPVFVLSTLSPSYFVKNIGLVNTIDRQTSMARSLFSTNEILFEFGNELYINTDDYVQQNLFPSSSSYFNFMNNLYLEITNSNVGLSKYSLLATDFEDINCQNSLLNFNCRSEKWNLGVYNSFLTSSEPFKSSITGISNHYYIFHHDFLHLGSSLIDIDHDFQSLQGYPIEAVLNASIAYAGFQADAKDYLMSRFTGFNGAQSVNKDVYITEFGIGDLEIKLNNTFAQALYHAVYMMRLSKNTRAKYLLDHSLTERPGGLAFSNFNIYWQVSSTPGVGVYKYLGLSPKGLVNRLFFRATYNKPVMAEVNLNLSQADFSTFTLNTSSTGSQANQYTYSNIPKVYGNSFLNDLLDTMSENQIYINTSSNSYRIESKIIPTSFAIEQVSVDNVNKLNIANVDPSFQNGQWYAVPFGVNPMTIYNDYFHSSKNIIESSGTRHSYVDIPPFSATSIRRLNCPLSIEIKSNQYYLFDGIEPKCLNSSSAVCQLDHLTSVSASIISLQPFNNSVINPIQPFKSLNFSYGSALTISSNLNGVIHFPLGSIISINNSHSVYCKSYPSRSEVGSSNEISSKLVASKDWVESFNVIDQVTISRDVDSFDLFPNPADKFSLLKIKSRREFARFKVSNSLGTTLIDLSFDKTDNFQLDMGKYSFQNGVYFVEVSDYDYMLVQKLYIIQ